MEVYSEMAEKAIGNLIVHMGLDDAQVRPTLKNIEQGIKAVDSAWKATYQSQKRVGDDLGAAKTKYDGLNEKLQKQKLLLEQQRDILKQTGARTKENAFDYDKLTTSIDKSKAKVERFTSQLKAQQKQYNFLKTGIPELNKQLKRQQETTEATSRALDDQGKHVEALKTTQNGYKDQMHTLNTLIGKQVDLLHTMNKDDDGDGYHAQEMRIANLRHEMKQLNTTYDSMDSKIKHQKDAESEQSIQIKDLRKEYSQAKETTNAYVESLIKQGKNYDALVEKQKGLKTQTKTLTKLVSLEQDKLKQMNKSDNGDAFHKQQLNVLKLKDDLRSLNGQFTKSDEAVKKIDKNPFSRYIHGAKEAKDKTQDFGVTTKKIMFANLAGNAIQSVWTGITSHINEAIKAGKKYWVEQQKMLAVWTTLTGDASKGKAMVNTINNLSVKTGQAVGVVNELQQGFYHLHSSKKEADMLTHAMLNMGDTVGLTGSQLKSVGQDMTHALAQGHLTTGALNQLAMYFPMVEEKLSKYEAKIHHKSHESSTQMVADLRKETKAGKVSAKAVESLFDQLGNHKYAKAAENIMQTMFGMERAIKARVPALIGDIESPFMKVKSPIYAALAKWVSDSRTDREFKKLGNSFALGATTISDAFAKAWHVNNFSKTADSGINALAKSIKNGSNYIAKNAKPITNFLKDIGGAGSSSLKLFANTMKYTTMILNPILKLAATHAKTFGFLTASIWAINKASKAYSTTLKAMHDVRDAFNFITEKLGIKSTSTSLAEQNQEWKENIRLRKEADEVGNTDNISDNVGGGGGGVGKDVDAAKDADKIAEDGKDAEKATGLLSKFKGASHLGKMAAGSVGIFDVLNSAIDLTGMTKKTVGSHVGAAGGSLGGTAAGAAIGTAILPGIGTAIGAGLGGWVGESAGRKLGKGIQKGLKGQKINPPKLSMTSAYNKLLHEGKDYYSKKKRQQIADIKLLYKNGDITKKEYEKRLHQIKSSQAKINTFTRTSQKGQTAITKAYVQARQKLSKSYNKRILAAENKYGKGSVQVEKLQNAKKKALARQRLKYETRVTVKEAKLQTSLTGHIRTAARKQRSIYKKLVRDKKKLSENDMKLMVANSHRERGKIISDANTKYKKVTSAAKKQKTKTIDAAKRQYKGNSSYAKRQRERITRKAEDQYHDVTNKAEKQRKDTVSKAKSQYKDTLHYAKKQHKDITTQSAEQYKTLKSDNSATKKNYHLTWHGIFKSVGNWIGKMLKGMNNTAIKGQNQVFKQYGGHQTLSPISQTHFAAGSGLLKNGLLQKPVLATLNDGYDSPSTNNREIIAHANGNLEPVNGRNVQKFLEPGSGVFNASESKMLQDMGLIHFAHGTGIGGFFENLGKDAIKAFKGIYGGLKDKLKAIAKFTSNPISTFRGVYPSSVRTSKSTLGNMYADLFDKKDKKQGQNWWNAAWNVINGAANGGGGGPVAHNPGAGWHVTSGFGYRGATGGGMSVHDGVDFSGGKVVHALEDAVVTEAGPGHWLGSNGVGEVIGTKGGRLRLIYQELNGKNAHGADLLVHVGEHIKRGQAIAKLGPDGTHVHIGATTEGLWDHGGSSTKGWLDVTKLHGSYGNKAAKKSSSGLSKLVAGQLKHSGVLSWVGKFLEPLADIISGADNPGGADVERWKPLVIKALKANGFGASASQVSAWMRVIARESNGNPRAVNHWDSNARAGHPSKGLVQMIQSTFDSNAFKGHHVILNGYDDLLAGIRYMSRVYGRGSSAFSRVSGSRGYEHGGLSTLAKLANISEKNKPEMILPLTDRNRSVELIEQAKKMMGVPKNEDSAQINALIKIVAGLSSTVSDLSDQLKQINDSIIHKPVVSDGMVGHMYDNYNKTQTLKKKLVRGEISL